MEAILPFKIKNEQKYFQSALKLGFDEMEIYKFIYVMQQSDLDVFPKMHDERINVLIYCWELCEDYKHKLSPDEWELPEELETILKLLVPWSLDIWFSKEWDKCKSYLKLGLVHCLNRARDLMMRMPDMMQINWDFLLLYNLTPWNVAYLRNLNVTKEKTLETGAQSIETQEQPANSDDLAYVKLEQLPLIVLRLIKLFDQCSIDMVKTLCMRVIAAWNKIYQIELQTTRRPPYIPPEDKRCLLLTCHIYLMAVYESDDVKGYVIDNLINNIRFYFQGFQTSTALYAMDNLEYTPARFIALTTIHLRLKKSEFFDFFIWNSYDTSLVNLFGVVSQAYKSYLLGNLLMELNNMNEDDFALNVPLYKRLMNSYVNEREKSELFLLNELDKLEIQRFAHNVPVVKSMTDFKSKICKGNRMSNIGNYENSDDIIAPAVDDAVKEVEMKETRRPSIKEEEDDGDSEIGESLKDKESDLRLDPIFQNIPNNENILYYVYEVLAKKDYKGWHFAKIVLLVKIIGHELNMIETWRYHPGLTTDFMLNLETKLSNHYADLAKIFKDHAFIEQEFWLTAFYLHPMPDTYETIKRLGMRNNRKRTDEHTKLVMSIDNIDAKYGLLSSTIDVKEIANLANTEEPDGDYDPLFSALKSLHLPDSLIKDMLTAIFLPRNRSFAWIIDWTELRTRCKVLLNNSKEKKRFVELNMAEANERLKFLNIDYEKYKNRPQLDYGTIEAGYENLMNREDYDHSEEEDDEEEEDFEDDEDVYESQRGSRGGRGAAVTKKEEKNEDDNSQEEDPYLTGKRRTRARAAAAVASYLFQSIPRATRRKRNKDNVLVSKDEYDDEKKKDENDEDNSDDNEKDADDKSNNSKSPITTSESKPTSPVNEDTKDSDDPDIIKKNIKECLNERPSILNTTPYFQPLIDIWNVEKSDLQSIDNNCVSLLESSMVLKRMAKLKLLNKQTNPLGCNEHEAIDETEMLIINTDFPMAKITNMQKDIKPIMVDSASEVIVKSENRKIVEPVVSNKSSGDKDMEIVTEIISDESNEGKESKDLEENKETGEDSDVEMVTEIISDDSNDEKELQELIKNRRRSIRNKHIDLVTEIISDESSEVKESKNVEEDKKPGKNEDIEMVTEIISDESNEEKECKDPIANEETSRDEDIEMVTEIISDESNEEKESKDFKEDEYTEVMDVEEIMDASITRKLNEDEVPVKLSDDKNENKERPSIDDSESFKSDMSTAALKDSEDVSAEVSESNFEINSKQNSEHTDFNEIEYNVDDIIEEITEEEQIKETEQENNKEEEGNKVENKDDKIMESKATKEDLEKDSNEKSSQPDTELSKETKDEIEKDLNEQSNKTDTVLSKESEEDVGKDLTKLSNQTDVESLKEAEEDLEKDLTDNSNKNDTKILPETNEKDSELTETSEELNTDKTKETKDNESELTQVSTETDSELPAVIDETVSTASSKESENVESEIGKTSEDKESDLIKKDSKIDDTDKTNKSEDLETVILKNSNVNETKITQKSEATESELTTKDINIVDSEMTEESKGTASETTAKDLKSSDAEFIKESEKTETELKTTDSNKDGTEISKESKDGESELTTKSSKNTDNEINKEIQDKESKLKAKDSENVSTEITKESKDSESKDSESKSPSDDSKSIVTETAKDSENVKSDLETKDSNSVGKEKIKESKDTESEIKSQDSKNDDAEIDNESTETKSDLKTQDSKNIDSEISEEKIKESKDSKCESKTQDSKNIDSETPIETDLKIQDSEITNEPKDTKSESLTKDSKNLDDEDKQESKDNTTEEALADKAEHDKEPSTTTSKEESANADENKADLDLVPQELNSPLLEDISMDSLRFDSDDEQQKSMKQICLTKRVRILMRRLRPEDVANLRQPKIKLKRINIEKAMEEFKATRKKRLLVKKAYLSIDDSSNNSTAGTTDSSDAAYRPPKTKAKLAPRRHSLRQPRTSESEIDSNNSDDVKLLNISSARFIRERRLSSTQHTSSSSNSSTIRSKRHHHTSSSGTTAAASSSAAASHLIVTPRSASGLKLRISNADQSDLVIPRKRRKTVIEVDDVIQLSSSSEDGGRGGSNNLTPIAEVIEIDDHPLFEEEILI